MLSMHPVCPELSSIITAWMVTEQSLRLLIRELIIDIMNLSGMEKQNFIFWDQQAVYQDTYANTYKLGRIYTNEELNSILDGSYAGILPSEDRSGHGTQVAAIAAGTNIGVAPQTELLVVKIGSDTASKLPTTLGLILGIDYAIRTGIEMNRPISINLSYGNNYGSHKGDSLLENYINDVSRFAICSISTGTGNDAINRRHQRVILGNTSYRMIDLLVSDYVASFNLQLWKIIMTALIL